jgi:probable F420-dependent oxidoreductase
MTTEMVVTAKLGRLGIWTLDWRAVDPAAATDAAAELDDSGWGALWIAGAGGPGIWNNADLLLTATKNISVALGVASIWGPDADAAPLQFNRLTQQHGHRLMAGFGVSSPQNATAVGKRFGSPLSAMNDYLDTLDQATPPLPANNRILGALGPKMVELAGTRAAGIHPFLVTPESNVTNRSLVGDGGLIAPHLAVVLETDPRKARQIARDGIGIYIGFPSYQANLRRLGFTDDDLIPGGSDRLIDSVVAWGTLDDVNRRISEHLTAGADHLALHVLTGSQGLPRSQWAELSYLSTTPRSAPHS